MARLRTETGPNDSGITAHMAEPIAIVRMFITCYPLTGVWRDHIMDRRRSVLLIVFPVSLANSAQQQSAIVPRLRWAR